MTSEARVAANRRNASKSTGPRTKQGKAIVAQNALKHGFGAHQDVIPGEDPRQFELLRRRLLGELAPLGEMETLFAERIVSLSWRLQRAQRLQNVALDYLLTREITESLEEFDEFVSEEDIEQMQSDPDTDPRLLVGRVVVRDCLQAKVLDRLMLHERRIEASLSRTLNDLHKLQRLREQEGGHLPTCEGEPADPTNSPCKTKPIEAGESACSVPATASPETPCGVTTNGDGDVKQTQSVTAEGGHSPPCETVKQSHSEQEVSSGAGPASEDEPSCETKPMEAAGSVCSVPAGASNEAPSARCEAPGGEPAPQTSHLKLDTPPETPCGVTTNGDGDAKQSQLAATAESHGQRAAHPASAEPTMQVPLQGNDSQTRPMEAAASARHVTAEASKGTPGGVTTNGANPAKQSQCRKPAAGANTMLRPRPRVAYHGHDIARSY